MARAESRYPARRRPGSRVRVPSPLFLHSTYTNTWHSQPGKYRAEWRGVAHADGSQDRAHVTFRCELDCYTLTGILLAHTALAILFDPDTVAREMGGGILTPSTVATRRYFDGLERAGVVVEVKMME